MKRMPKWIEKEMSGQPGQKTSRYDVTSYMDGMPQPDFSGGSPEMMKKISWVYSCIRVKSQTMKRIPFHVMPRKGDDKITSGPLVELLEHPNPFMSGREMRANTVAWLDIHGDAYWALDGIDRKGRPSKIWTLDPRRVQVVPDRQDFISGYVYDVDGKLIPFEPDEILHFKTFNPFSLFYGMGTIEGIASTLEMENYRNLYDRNFFKNGAKVAGVVEAPQELSDPAFKRLKKEWKRTYAGMQNAYKTAILEGGAQYKPISLSQKDMEFLEMAQMNRDRILAAFGVPPSKLGLVEDANLANSKGQDVTFLADTMSPITHDIAEKITTGLAARYGQRIEPEEMAKEDQNDLFQRYSIMAKYGDFTQDERRAYLGYDPLPEDVKNNDNNNANVNNNGGDNNQNNSQANNQNEGGKMLDMDWQEAQEMIKGIRESFHLSRATMLGIHRQNTIIPKLKQYFSQQEDRVITRLLNNGKDGQQYNFTPEELVAMTEANALLQDMMMPIYMEICSKAFVKAGFWFGADLRFDPTSNPKQAAIIQTLANRVTRVNETTKQHIRKEVGEGMRRGYSVYQIAQGYAKEDYKGIAGVFEDARGYRAEMIARSESADAYNMASLLGYKQMGETHVGVIDGVDWDESCREANGSTWSIDYADDNLKEHPNCTRAFYPMVDKQLMALAEKDGLEALENLEVQFLKMASPKPQQIRTPAEGGLQDG